MWSWHLGLVFGLCIKRFRKKQDSLHVALQLVNGALVQVTAEQREQVWGQKERLHQWTLGQLTRHLEYCVRPKDNRNKAVKISYGCSKNLPCWNISIKTPTRSQSHRCWALKGHLRTAASLRGTGERTVRTVQTEKFMRKRSEEFHTEWNTKRQQRADLVLTCQCEGLVRRQRLRCKVFEDAD